MTQLVELQRALPKFQAAGAKLYAISYDDVEGLAAFTEAYDIGFPLLSDAGSALIRRFGILNTIVGSGEPLFYGIPYPGTYVVDEAGVVVQKLFSRHVANRESPETLIDSALGRILIGPEEPQTSAGDGDVTVTAAFHGGGGVLLGGGRHRIVVRIEPREGLHLYSDPAPEGMVATRVEVEGPAGLVVEPAIFPPSESLRLADLAVDLQVWSGAVDIEVPVFANSQLIPMLEHLEERSASIQVTVRYQACDDRTCLIPRTERLTLDVPLEGFVVPRVAPFAGSGQRFAPISPRLVLKLARRGALRRPVRTLALATRLAVRRLRRRLQRFGTSTDAPETR